MYAVNKLRTEETVLRAYVRKHRRYHNVDETTQNGEVHRVESHANKACPIFFQLRKYIYIVGGIDFAKSKRIGYARFRISES